MSESKKVVSLQSQKGEQNACNAKAKQQVFLRIVPWCNGNTTDFGSVISSSSLDGITKVNIKITSRNWLRLIPFFFFTNKTTIPHIQISDKITLRFRKLKSSFRKLKRRIKKLKQRFSKSETKIHKTLYLLFFHYLCKHIDIDSK